MNFRSLNLSTKLILSVAIGIVLGIVVIVLTVSIYTSKSMEKEAKDSIFLSSKRYVNYMEGILNEEVVLTKAMATSLNEIFSKNDQVNAGIIESLLRNTFDSSGYAAYAFLYLQDSSILTHVESLDKNFKNSDGKSVTMIFFDETTGKAGGIKSIHAPSNFSQLPIIEKIKKNARYGDLDTIFLGSPSRLNYDGTEFLGINLGMPLFNKEGKFIGIVGFTFDFLEISETILDPKLDFYKDDLRFLITDQGVIVIHKNKDAILKTLPEINQDASVQLIIDAVKNHKDLIIDNYVDLSGNLSYAGVASFSTLGDSSHWSIVVTAPKNAVLAPLYKLQFIFIVAGIVFLMAVITVVYYCVRVIIGRRLPIIVKALESLFRFLNHEKVDLSPIKIHANDELGVIGKMLNENILATKRGLEQDNQAVKESVQTVSVVEGGNLTARITANPRNPQLIELKNVLNKLLDVLQARVGSDMNAIHKIFEEYKSLDFRNKLENASGSVELTTNALGDEIVKMLKQSSDFANALANESGKLQTAVQSLTTSSNSQAQSLEETAAALEEITSSMQNVSVKTSDVITQSEEIKNVTGIIGDIADQINLLALNA
ncbi:TPA: methyl-accepting chemotaxis protein, partial [Campylobacter jejuni]|nr:methyl-accepting chemotaxis protein [Campylobacter jejuni]